MVFPLNLEEITAFQKAAWAGGDTVQTDMNKGMREGSTDYDGALMIENESFIIAPGGVW